MRAAVFANFRMIWMVDGPYHPLLANPAFVYHVFGMQRPFELIHY